jgi:hypothetical protein
VAAAAGGRYPAKSGVRWLAVHVVENARVGGEQLASRSASGVTVSRGERLGAWPLPQSWRLCRRSPLRGAARRSLGKSVFLAEVFGNISGIGNISVMGGHLRAGSRAGAALGIVRERGEGPVLVPGTWQVRARANAGLANARANAERGAR